jgi:molybdate transport system substrate-binding protein
MRRSVLIAAVLATALALSACGSSQPRSQGGPSGPSAAGAEAPEEPSGAVTGTVNVFAAASLTETFTSLGHQFEAAHPGTRVVFNFGPSSGLATQINQGAPADVFASASTTNMSQVVKQGNASNPTTFAKNVMEIAIPASNPAHVTELDDLRRPGVKVAVCQPEVPCGVIAHRVFGKAGVDVTPVSLETDVKSVLTKVALGEVDAGMVYVTDVRTAGSKVRGIRIPARVNASTDYPIATLSHSGNPAAARAFTDYVLSNHGASVMKSGGFAQP